MTPRLEAVAALFNPAPSISVVPIAAERVCVVVDNALLDPEALVDWAATQAFEPPRGYPYPGLVLGTPAAITQRVGDFFALHARSRIGARRTLDVVARLSLVTVPPAELEPIQWQCHRDQLAVEPDKVLFAASVLYLFRNPALGGTSFYKPLQPEAQIKRMTGDSESLTAADFSARYGLRAGYMVGSNPYFEHAARVPAAWNRMIFYDGGLFHSADIDASALSADPRAGRLTLNGFYTCRRNAQ